MLEDKHTADRLKEGRFRPSGFGSALLLVGVLLGAATQASAHNSWRHKDMHHYGSSERRCTAAGGCFGSFIRHKVEEASFFIGGNYELMRYGEDSTVGMNAKVVKGPAAKDGSAVVEDGMLSLSDRSHPSADLFGLRAGAYVSETMRIYLSYAKSSSYHDWFSVLESSEDTTDYALNADFLFGRYFEIHPFVGLSYGKLILDRQYSINSVSVGNADSVKEWYWGARAGLLWRPVSYPNVDVELGSRYMHLSGEKTIKVDSGDQSVNGILLQQNEPITVTRHLQPATSFYAAVNYRF